MIIQHLVHYRLVKIIDLFKFTNMYSATQRLAKLAHKPSKQSKFKEFLKAQVILKDESLLPALNDFPLSKLTAFLGCMTNSQKEATTVKDFILEYYQPPTNDEEPKCESLLGEPDFVKKLVQYAVLKKLIKRVHAHVLCVKKPQANPIYGP